MNRRSVARHEATCFKNPARRACPTCVYEIFAWGDYDSYGEDRENRPVINTRDCEIDAFTKDEIEAAKSKDVSPIRFGCETWIPKGVPK